MDALLRELERSLSPDDLQRVRDILNAARPLSPKDLKFLLAAIIACSNNPGALMRYLWWLVRLGLLDAQGVSMAMAEAEAILAETAAAQAAAAEAAAAAGGGTAAGGGAVAGGATGGAAASGGGAAAGGAAGLGLGAILSILAALLAVLYAGYSMYTEANTDLYTPPVPLGGGAPCGVGTPGGQRMAKLYRSISVWGIGQRSTLNKAIRAAEALCAADAAFCGGGGGCGPGTSCQPDVAIQDVSIFNGFLATRVVVGFTCPCVCK